MAAKMGKNVLSIDPYISNIYGLHRSINVGNHTHKISLIYNIISDKKNQKMVITKTKNQEKFIVAKDDKPSALKDVNSLTKPKDASEQDVYSILIDDLVDLLPKINTSNESAYRNLIMKIDRDSLERLAFSNAEKFFKKFKISVIFMEWKSIK